MNVAHKINQEPIGVVKMTESLHDNVSFLNPGDTLLLEPKHWRAGESIVERLQTEKIISGKADGKEKLVIEISGPSGAGKTEIGYCIGAFLGALGYRCVCYSTDNCYEVEPIERGKMRQAAAETGNLASMIGKEEYDWKLIQDIEQGVLEGAVVATPVVDVTKAERPIKMADVDYSEYDVLLLDGLYAVGGIAPVKVCIDQTWEGILHAQKERGKETTDELRMSIIRLEMEAVKELEKVVEGTIFKIDTKGEVSFLRR